MPEDRFRTAILTGSIGFLGRYFLTGLRADGWIVFESEFDLAGTTPDYRFPEAAKVVIHLAGLAHRVPRTPAESDEFFEINARGTQRLLKQLPTPESFVLISTVAVYGRESGENLGEETPRQAEDPYGASKIEAEDAVLDWAQRQGVRVAVLRLPLVIGSSAPGNFGRMVDAIRRGRYFGIGASAARRSMVLAEDVAGILSVAAERGGTYHLTDGQHPSFAELEETLSAALGRRTPLRLPMPLAKLAAAGGDAAEALMGRAMPFNRRILDKMTATLTFNDARAREVIGWTPRPVVEALPEVIAAWS